MIHTLYRSTAFKLYMALCYQKIIGVIGIEIPGSSKNPGSINRAIATYATYISCGHPSGLKERLGNTRPPVKQRTTQTNYDKKMNKNVQKLDYKLLTSLVKFVGDHYFTDCASKDETATRILDRFKLI